MTKTGKILTTLLLATLPWLCPAADGQLTVKAVNKLQFARPHQTIELSASQLAPLGEKDLTKIHIKDDAGKEHYMADSGDFIAVLNLPGAMLDLPVRSTSALEARTSASLARPASRLVSSSAIF